MNIMGFFKKKQKKKTLRELCRDAYGNAFVEMYDDINRGIPIGGFFETMCFLDMVEKVKRENEGRYK